MAFLDEFGKKITKTSQSVAKKAKDAAEIGNLKLQIKEEERALRGIYAELGEKYYVLHSEDPEAAMAETVEKASTAKRKIGILEDHIAKIENERICPNCSSKLPDAGMFCPACGEKYPEQETEEEDAAAVEFHTCRTCGAQVLENEVFCTKCGVKQEEGVEVPKEEEVADVVEEPEVCQDEVEKSKPAEPEGTKEA